MICAPEHEDEVTGRSAVLGQHFNQQIMDLSALLITGIEALEMTGETIRYNGNPKFKFEISDP